MTSRTSNDADPCGRYPSILHDQAPTENQETTGRILEIIQNAFNVPPNTRKRKFEATPLNANSRNEKLAKKESSCPPFNAKELLELSPQECLSAASNALLAIVKKIINPDNKNKLVNDIVNRQASKHFQVALEAAKCFEVSPSTNHLRQAGFRALGIARPDLFSHHFHDLIQQIPPDLRSIVVFDIALALAESNPIEALNFAGKIEDIPIKDGAFSHIAQQLSARDIPSALNIAKGIHSTAIREEALTEILPSQGVIDVDLALENAQILIREDKDFLLKAQAGIYLDAASIMKNEDRRKMIEQAFLAANAIEEPELKDEVLWSIAKTQASMEGKQYLDTIRLMESKHLIDDALFFICCELGQNNLQEALDLAEVITCKQIKFQTLHTIAIACVRTDLDLALKVAGKIDNESDRVYAQQKIASCIAVEQPKEAMNIARNIQDPLQKVMLICKIAKLQLSAEESLVPGILQEAIEIVDLMDDQELIDICTYEIAKVLVSFDSYQALDRCSRIKTNECKVKAFCMIATALLKQKPREAYGIFRLALLVANSAEQNKVRIELLNHIVAALPEDAESKDGISNQPKSIKLLLRN